INSHDNFYCSQHKDGMINRVINESDGMDHWWGQGPDNARAINPPLFTWAEIETFKATGDKSRFELVIDALEKYALWIEQNRRGYDTPHQLYWSNGQASGMDNTPRDYGRPEPGDGWDYHSAIDHVGWVDMSSQMAIFYRDLSYIYKELGRNDQAKLYSKKAAEVSERINRWLWSEDKGLYFDVNPNGEKTSWITAATFWPLLAEVSSKEQAGRLVENLLDPTLFWRTVPVPTLAANQPEYDITGRYWKGGVWAPTNYMIVKGLSKYGYDELAKTVSLKYLEAIERVHDKTKIFWEVYSPEAFTPATNATGIHLVEPNFVGWTGLAPISMVIEHIIGIEVDASKREISWNITEDYTHGIKQLNFMNNNIDLMAYRNSYGFDVEINSPIDFTLKIKYNGEYDNYKVVSGSVLRFRL
ncbi:MAG: MGH1-like glycoside hydrolase domain-containing protein, partial [Bacteroidales bacterium]